MGHINRRTVLAALGFTTALSLSGAAWAQDLLKVAAVWTVPVEQQWASRLHNALVAADERGEIDYVYSENISNTDYERVMREYAEQGIGLLVGEAFGVEQPARAVAADYPEIAFLMGSSLAPVEPNFATFDNFIHEPSYLTGIIAGMKTETNKIGMVGGYAIPEVNRLMHAFMAGVLSVNPEVKFSVSFINSWYDPPKAKETAFAMVDAGADILYAERFGVSDAAKERGILAIGNVIDTSADYPGTILASALWNGAPMIDQAIKDVQAGSFTASDYGIYAFMKYGGGSLVVDETLAGPDAVAAAKDVEAKILDGSFVVEIDDTEPKSN
ncbi:BMP family protein [Devosia sp. 63-57]|uniref:BMP family protein n=1 Tax=Devosia sp. 63-57 TaxID=1895751 RepID=UPI00086BEBFD|nr:BMP family protein [Devosia sp. 63-57]ODT50874.1 MAG: BMP family ABC transporter substrate-binding protein [Pelagibacterium sp. SCN 63-126]ODU80525.1 MAG: BMP family ABC transporter substrate-binding protein [Pelagibacterium sp. SCN 63-17]OJX44465.1 MAG: BMP family ABC transporter substrate-binding protein [Devosia sp. 63-57]